MSPTDPTHADFARSMSASLGMAPEPVPEPDPESVLQEAQRIIHGPRRASYGHPLENFTAIAQGWGVILKCDVVAEDVALCMAWLKICRHNHGADRDSIVDLAGYAGCLELIAEGRKARPGTP
jgi:hypothetical protein